MSRFQILALCLVIFVAIGAGTLQADNTPNPPPNLPDIVVEHEPGAYTGASLTVDSQTIGWTLPPIMNEEANPIIVQVNSWVDTSNRQAVNDYYFNNYLPSENTAMNWSGNHNACNAGDTSQAYRDAVLMRVNYYRAMAGVSANIIFTNEYNQKAQEAALMFSVNGTLSHNPPTNWTCYTANGAEAAGNSNIALGYSSGWASVTAYMDEGQSQNLGHRRWIIYPQTQEMGTGQCARYE